MIYAVKEIVADEDDLCLEEPYSVDLVVDGRRFYVADIREVSREYWEGKVMLT